jgi:hypothetical protein
VKTFPSQAARRLRGLGAITGVVLLTAAGPPPAGAVLRQVPASYPTLASAVAAAASGDTVLIAPGSYTGGAWIDGKALTIASGFALTGDTTLIAQTVLDGVAAGVCSGAPGCHGTSVLEFGADAHGSAVIGLTLRDGENGISSASIVDITRCRVLANGDGVDFTAGSGGTFRNSLFADNRDDGIDLNGRMDVTVMDNEIRNNRDDGIEFRLHAYTGAVRQVDIVRNRITGNGEDGVQLIDYPGTHSYVVRIERNLFQSNFDAGGVSAAIGCMPDGESIETLTGAPMAERVYVIRNTFVGEQNGVVGGANAIVLDNLFSGTAGTSLLRVAGGSIAAYNLLWGGTPHAESNVDLPHTLVAPPLLDPAGVPTPASPAIDAGAAFYQSQGLIVLNLPPSSYAGSAPDLGAFETPANTPPLVSAGPDRVLSIAGDAMEIAPSDALGAPPGDRRRADLLLDGTISDDGLPYPPALHAAWSVVSGPAPLRFMAPRMAEGRAAFFAPGTYVLRLTADDGALSAWDEVEITVEAEVNLPPGVDAGPGQTVMFPAGVTLSGSATDDGLPNPPGVLTLAWTMASGPAPVAFDDSTSARARVAFPAPGSYVLRLEAGDGDIVAADSVQVTVLPPPPPVERRIGAPSDDMEESESGRIVRNASDLDLVYDSGNQTVGLLFTGVEVPPGSTIIAAFVQFEADAPQSEATNLVLHGQAADDAATFTSADFDVSSRPRTTASASWSPPPWSVAGEAGPDQRTTDLTTVIQEIVDRPGWASGNAIGIIVTGTGRRTARTQEIAPSGAALLHVEYGGLPQPDGPAPAGAARPGPSAGATPPRPGPAGDAGPSIAASDGFAFLGVRPQPSRGSLRIDFSLAEGAGASLELVDAAGRRVAERDLGALGAGRHSIELRDRLPVGVYLVRLTQRGRTLVKKAVVLR